MSGEPEHSKTHLDTDLHCIACGYNLRGLDQTGHCPECGSQIAPSLRVLRSNDFGVAACALIAFSFLLLLFYPITVFARILGIIWLRHRSGLADHPRTHTSILWLWRFGLLEALGFPPLFFAFNFNAETLLVVTLFIATPGLLGIGWFAAQLALALPKHLSSTTTRTLAWVQRFTVIASALAACWLVVAVVFEYAPARFMMHDITIATIVFGFFSVSTAVLFGDLVRQLQQSIPKPHNESE